MADCFSSDKRSEIMSRVRSKDTRPELRLRSALWRKGLRYRKHYRVEGTQIDLAMPGRALAIFVDGCFWHGCPEHYSEPKTNTAFWRSKVAANRRRDRAADKRLRNNGWRVLRIWQCEIEGDLDKVLASIARAAHR